MISEAEKVCVVEPCAHVCTDGSVISDGHRHGQYPVPCLLQMVNQPAQALHRTQKTPDYDSRVVRVERLHAPTLQRGINPCIVSNAKQDLSYFYNFHHFYNLLGRRITDRQRIHDPHPPAGLLARPY